MQKHFAGYQTITEDTMPDGKHWLLWVGSSCLPGAYILFNHETSEANILAFSHDKALSEDRLTPAEYFTFPAKNGARLSARLWRPAHRPIPPLIVYCPDQLPASAVRDEFEPDVQAFVMQGFAVLKVNVRNSWVFGKVGRQVPDNKWAAALQEDLDAAVQLLIGKKLVDPARVTLFGRDYGGVLALQVAMRSQCYAAVATINAPAKMHRYDLLYLTTEFGVNPLASKLGGWRNSEKLAKEMSPILAAPNLPIPALYLHDEESIKGRPDEDGRAIRAAAKNAKVPAQTGLAFSWSQYPKPPSKYAREAAEISMKITAFFEQCARTGAH
jgi:dipeptidyl aminopeptidase/acylaminoacyl peptidase